MRILVQKLRLLYAFFVIQDEGWLYVLHLRVFCVRLSAIFAKLRLIFVKLLRLK